ncbi:unnamed protein product [Toxocara canis]|uniref:KIAA0753 n=1 Tax=Toxocara canis TaxID=6265 RepID=A0A183U9W0_TOXCA|nr:unnamed protein product [Toxocara canis]
MEVSSKLGKVQRKRPHFAIEASDGFTQRFVEHIRKAKSANEVWKSEKNISVDKSSHLEKETIPDSQSSAVMPEQLRRGSDNRKAVFSPRKFAP